MKTATGGSISREYYDCDSSDGSHSSKTNNDGSGTTTQRDLRVVVVKAAKMPPLRNTQNSTHVDSCIHTHSDDARDRRDVAMRTDVDSANASTRRDSCEML